MRRLLTVLLPAAALALWGTAAADAGQANPHFVGTPTCTKNTSTFVLTCSGKAAGLDELPTQAFLTASSVDEHVVCVNHGGNIAPGQGTSTASVQGPTENIAPHNGQITFSVKLNPPPKPTPKQAGCPNGNWTVRILSVTYNDVVLHIQQGSTDVLTFSFGDIDP